MSVRIGCATAWSGDRFAPAADLVARGVLDYLFFDSMSETTMSGAQIKRAQQPDLPGYDPYLERRLRPILAECQRRKTRIVTNQGWLDPVAAAQAVASFGVRGLKIAAVVAAPLELEPGTVSAEPYLGAERIVEALDNGADVVITPRVTDSAMVLGPLLHEFGWSDWDDLARGVVIGHLLECGTQVTGGNFADPGYDDVPGLADLGHPIAEVDTTTAVIGKVPDSGGIVSTATCKAQLLWEVGDPTAYVTPDVIADFTDIAFKAVSPDRVAVLGGKGAPPPDTLKVLIGVNEGFLSEEMVLYAGPNALARARLAEEILRARLSDLDADLRFDYVGINAIHREATPADAPEPHEVALRVAVRGSRDEVAKLADAVAPMAVSGPIGTGKWGTLTERVRPIVGMRSALVPAEQVPATVRYFES